MIDRIEVIRGPAAAMYGNGAMGGVVNIITKQASKEWHGTFNTYYDVPDHKKRGHEALQCQPLWRADRHPDHEAVRQLE